MADGICLCYYVGMDYWPLCTMLLLSIAEVLVLPPHYAKIVTLWPVVLKWSYIREGTFRCSLKFSPNVLEDSSVYSSSHSTLSPLHLYMTPLFFLIFWSLQTWGSHVVNWQKLAFKFKYLFCYWENLLLHHRNRVRNIHLLTRTITFFWIKD